MRYPNFGIAESPKALDRFLRDLVIEVNDLNDLATPLREEREKRLAAAEVKKQAELSAKAKAQTKAEKLAEARRIIAEAKGKAEARKKAEEEAKRLAKIEAEKLAAAKELLEKETNK